MPAPGQGGSDWVNMPDGGWLPPDNPAAQAYMKTKPASGTSTSAPGTGTSSPNAGGGLFDFNIPAIETPTSNVSVSGGGALPASSPSPVATSTQPSPTPGGGIFDIPAATPAPTPAPVGTGTGAGVTPGSVGTTAPPISTTTAPKTVTVNGQTYTIPAAPDINTTPVTGASPTANAPGLAYTPEDPMLATVREQLLALMARANGTPSLNDPTVKPAADAYTAAQERARRGLQAGNAETLSARGLGSSGAADSANRQSYETMGQNIGEFNAKLLTDEQTARRSDLKSALEMANTLGMFKEQTALQRDLASLDTQTKVNLANLNAQLTTAGLNVQERLGIMDAELKKYGINLQGDQALLQTILKNDFDYAQLKVQGDVANLDANVKLQLKKMDGDLQKQGYGLQERLALLDAEVRKYGINTQGDLGKLDVALRKELGIGQLNLGLLNALLGNQQFNDGLGWDMAKTIIGQNANAVTGA